MRRGPITVGLSIIILILISFKVFAQCEIDLDNDGDFDGRDVKLFTEEFGRTDCESGPPCNADIHPLDFPDGVVGKFDLAELGENLGRTDVGVWLDCSVIG